MTGTPSDNPGPPPGLPEKLANLPARPGVYLFRNTTGDVIYIGKARSLRSRVRSYFQESRERDAKTGLLVSEIHDLEYIVTGSEYEAFLLESNLVHEHRPHFNIFLKDDKSFPFIKLTVQEQFPRIGFTRRPVRDGSCYYGPFIPAERARSIIDIVRKQFGIRTCRKEIDGNAVRPCCLDYHIHLCLAPCAGAICTPEHYRRAVADARLFLEGKTGELLARLEARMTEAAAGEQFEEAARCRDRLTALRSLSQSQQVMLAGENDLDAFAAFRSGNRLAVQVFHFRSGKVVDRRQFFWEELEDYHPPAFWREFIPQFYFASPSLPPVVLLPGLMEDEELVRQWLTEKRGRAVAIRMPQRGPRAQLMKLARANARHAFFARFPGVDRSVPVLEELRTALALEQLPLCIEAFDISNSQGREVVASLVVAVEGRMDRSRYRRFRIRSSDGVPDDFAAMREVVFRRYHRLLREGGELPGLVMVDGGAGQVSAALTSLTGLGLQDRLPLIGLAKREEEVFRPGGGEPLRLPRQAPALKLLQQIRDEAHRFAITYHRQRRQQASLGSRLEELPGIGPARRRVLLRRFGGWPKIRQATEAELQEVLGSRTGSALFRHLHPEPA